MTDPRRGPDGRFRPGSEQLTREQAAGLADITVETFRTYVRDGYAPQPDGHLGRTPYWYRRTIVDWLARWNQRGRRPERSIPT
jgi:hypothetical protein